LGWGSGCHALLRSHALYLLFVLERPTSDSPLFPPRTQAFDSVFVLWRPDLKTFAAYVSTTKPGNTPNFPDFGVGGPFNVLTAGLSAENYTALNGLITLVNAPGGLTAPLPGPSPGPTAYQALTAFSRFFSLPTWAAVALPGFPVPIQLNPLIDYSTLPLPPEPQGLVATLNAAKTYMVGSTNRLSMSYPCSDTPDPATGMMCFYSTLPGVKLMSFVDTGERSRSTCLGWPPQLLGLIFRPPSSPSPPRPIAPTQLNTPQHAPPPPFFARVRDPRQRPKPHEPRPRHQGRLCKRHGRLCSRHPRHCSHRARRQRRAAQVCAQVRHPARHQRPGACDLCWAGGFAADYQRNQPLPYPQPVLPRHL